ncbi:CobW family GTP-binding protein [Chitinimonas taiwanensis]|uniref:GTPase, G3E family n=1 Tax=Chitinimonas taiwanensis DSM 18899 TaxID=1121279 RepID=A0A1K2H5Z5_9NEIS|nr:GTP-binding protein [Chitinimonas taiwanensis]SFZ70819.1 GTPase, G3E family [Chitinimonas taiwanensis DSM 18899]
MNKQKVPVNLITGFLGVGKTTAIRRLLANKPAEQYWAVLVNEFGEVGIDGAAISSASAQLNVVEVPGGCICCTTSPMLRVSLTKLLRERRPDRLIIEPSGLGHPSGIIDVLRDPYLAAALDVRATITLVDPRQLNDTRYTSHEIWREQITLADVLIANKCDRADAAEVDHFMAMARGMYPPKLAVQTTSQGEFELGLLDLRGEIPAPQTPASELRHRARSTRQASSASERSQMSPGDVAGEGWVVKDHTEPGQASRGWVWAPEVRFSAQQLAELFQRLHAHSTLGLLPVQRAKGVFHTDHGWLLFNWVGNEASAVEIAWRRDSRAELIVSGDVPDWHGFETAMLACILPPTPSTSAQGN